MENKKKEIMSELFYLKERIEKLEQLFNLSENEADIEAIIYEEKAVMLRYSRVLREAKRLGIRAEEGLEECTKY